MQPIEMSKDSLKIGSVAKSGEHKRNVLKNHTFVVVRLQSRVASVTARAAHQQRVHGEVDLDGEARVRRGGGPRRAVPAVHRPEARGGARR
jgi:hypothetical protein